MEPADAVAVARMLQAHGCDIVDVSAGQTVPDQRPVYGRLFQTPFADRIRHEVGHGDDGGGEHLVAHGREHDHRRRPRRPVRAGARAPLRSALDAARRVDARYPLPWPGPHKSVERYAAVRVPFHRRQESGLGIRDSGLEETPTCLGTLTQVPPVTYSSYLEGRRAARRCSSRARTGPSTTRCCSSSSTRSTSSGSRSCCTSSIACSSCSKTDEPHRAQHTLKRILTILKVMVAQLDILETMTPLEFLSFRERLEAASGFQSDQFRQIEFLLGVKSEQAIMRFPDGSRARAALERRYQRADAVGRVSALPVARELRRADRIARARRDRAGRTVAELQRILVDGLPHATPKNAELCERLVDLDEGVQEWRVSAREDGRAHDRRQARAPAVRQARPTCAKQSAADLSTCGRSDRSCDIQIAEFRFQIRFLTVNDMRNQQINLNSEIEI
mgnify:CR=1 FL=1